MNKDVKQIIKAAHDMGKIEALVKGNHSIGGANELSRYLVNAEIADMPAAKEVLDEIETFWLSNRRLKKLYTNYKNKYYKS